MKYDFIALEIDTAHPDDAKELVKIEVFLLQVLEGKEYTRAALKKMILKHWHWKLVCPEYYAEYQAECYLIMNKVAMERTMQELRAMPNNQEFLRSYETAGRAKRGVTDEQYQLKRAMEGFIRITFGRVKKDE